MSKGWGLPFAALLLASACVPRSVADIVEPDDASAKSDTVRTGIETTEDAERPYDLGPYGFRVQWIAWDSAFRDTELRIGDRIVGVDGERYRRAQRQTIDGKQIGGWAEPQVWKARGKGDGETVALTVWRRGEILTVEGELRAERLYYTPDEKRALGPGGPYRLANDGFRSAWSRWYEDQVRFSIRVLDRGWRRGSFNNRMLLKQHRGDKERVDYLVEQYPGPFAEVVKADWQRVHDALLGPERRITAEDLEYRSLGKQRARAVAKAAKEGRRAFLQRYEDDVIEPFPAADPIEGDLQAVSGKVVALPELGRRDWISEAGHGYLVAGDRRRGFYFVDSRSDAMRRVLFAQHRYRELVSPKIDETFAIIGRIRDEPTMRVVRGRAVTGLAVEVLGATVGDAMFVDAQVVEDGESSFAGQEELADLGDADVPRDAPPRQVIEAAITALKTNNKQAWAELLAPWRLSIYGAGRISFDPLYYSRPPARGWVSARRLILGDVYDVNVVDVGLTHRLTSGDEFPDAPVIEQVEVELEHIGKFPEGYRPFVNSSVRRVWTLQRLDGGPWRIVTRRPI